MITKIRLRNWKSHESTILEFDEGTNVIVGRMGAGKSSVFDAISFALFGTFPALNSRRTSIESVIQNRGKEKNEAEVEVEIRIGNDVFSVKRIIKKGRGIETSELRKNGTLIAYPQSRKVTAEVEKLVGMDYDLFSRAIYGEQNNLDAFLNMTRSERKKKIDELMGMNKFDMAIENAKKLSNQFKREAELIKIQISELKQFASEDELKQMAMEIEKVLALEKEMDGKIKRIKQEAEKAESMLQASEKEKEKMGKLKERLSSLKSQEEMFMKEMAELPEYNKEKMEEEQNMEKHMNEARREQKELMNILAEKEKQAQMAAMVRKQIEEARARKEQIRKEIESLHVGKPADISPIEEQLRKILSEISSSRKEILEEEKAIEEISRAGSVCPVCESPLTEHHKKDIINQKSAKIEGLKQKLEKLESKKQAVEKLLNDTRKKNMEIQKNVERARALEEMLSRIKEPEPLEFPDESEIEKLKAQLREAEERENKIKERLSELRAEIEKMERRKAIEKRLSAIRAEAEEAKAMLKKIDMGLVEQYEKLKHDYIQKREEMAKLNSEIARLKEKKQSLTQSIEKADKVIKARKQKEARLGFLEYASKYLVDYSDSLKVKQMNMREKYTESLNMFMDEIWSDMYPYEDFTSIRLNTENNDYELELNDGTKWVKVDGTASGGERTLAVLVMRLAISLLLTKDLRFILLDEPTHNMDDNAISMFSEVLRTRIGDYATQVIIITHEEKLESAVTGNFYLLEKKGMVTKVARQQKAEP